MQTAFGQKFIISKFIDIKKCYSWKALIVCLLVNLPDNIQTSFSIAEDVSEHKIVGVTEFDEMENEITFENRDGFWWRRDIQSINFMIHIEIKALSGKYLKPLFHLGIIFSKINLSDSKFWLVF